MAIHFPKMSSKVEVELKEAGYFNPYDGCREVEILSRSELEKKLGIDDLSDDHKKFKESGFLLIKKFNGTYFGERQDEDGSNVKLKIEPFYGIMSPDSEYFIIPHEQIKSISEYKTISEYISILKKSIE